MNKTHVIDRTKETEVIRVRGDVYDRIAAQAEQHKRKMGAQVEVLVDSVCTHPVEARVELNIELAPVEGPTDTKAATVGKGQPYRGFYCSRCGAYSLNEPLPTEIRESLARQLEVAK